LRGRKTVRADRRLRTDDDPIRAQSAILYKDNTKPFLLLFITVFLVRMFFPYQKHGWRAQRASLLLACDGI
jgi:hypothetical protein